MDRDLARLFRRLARGWPPAPWPMGCPVMAQAFPGTGLCPEAQADGVPCAASGRPCERCSRAWPAAPPAAMTASRIARLQARDAP